MMYEKIEYASPELITELLNLKSSRNLQNKALRKLRQLFTKDQLYEILQVLKELRNKHAA